MNYIEWKKQLHAGISLLEESEQNTILCYYDELFQDKLDEGFSQDKILKAFGKPSAVASDLVGGLGVMDKSSSEEKKQQRKREFKEKFDVFAEAFSKKTNEFLQAFVSGAKKFFKIAKRRITDFANDWAKNND